ncbi:MAG: alpha/beta fold hydrolase [Candidatus Microthrix parvicella]|jgi:pimeloyl-ACP methyl ester carboxylesterase|uniref:Putative alpha/beta hydrolase fold protein n=1 Tax=Candidatus Neomicrothrix parvicella RN1 TaxID=1229780 RepID=R4YX08_9ACTN|nr:alpha/beta hydrolase [Candidatus Microthrix parvicella]MBP7595269.1 alpha/beta fold hydrolase [Candidatus Microthrix sp.]NLH66914.1 alpha/beta fold hydrolase [Candidatus Microthrix parvicella]CCM62794.1 putative alpha/beta hydrolase fold protein [Candidatus Microthrix parvicella RN1]HBX10667.1 alpha/beta hydrolase [Candidatus Microthrix parvicella]
MALPVVLVHGFGTSFELTWVANGWVDLLGDDGREAIGVDLLGHGTGPKPHDVAAYDDLGAPVVEALPPDGQVDAIGFSLGAKTLLKVAAAHPDRFRSLIVAGVGANLFRSDDMSAVVQAVRSGEDGDIPALGYFSGLAQLPGNDREALAACMTNGGGRVSSEELAAISCPVLVVLGEHDFVQPADRLIDSLANARLVTLPRTDHARTPKSFEFIDAALDFLRVRG